MNDRSFASDNNGPESPRTKLKFALQLLYENMHYVERCVSFTKQVLGECCDKLEELRSQVTELESLIEEGISEKEPPKDTSESIRGKNKSRNIFDKEIIEEINIEEDSDKNSTKRRKIQKSNADDDEISIITTPQMNAILQRHSPGTSGQARFSTIRTLTQDEIISSAKNFVDSAQVKADDDVVEMALKKTEGELSAQELRTFLYLSDQVEDPIQLAKISFAKDTKRLYFQLMTFHFHLKVANDLVEIRKGTSSTNRDLENKVQRLIHIFQTEN